MRWPLLDTPRKTPLNDASKLTADNVNLKTRGIIAASDFMIRNYH